MTNSKVDIRALATLARMEVSEDELSKLEKEIPGILGFVKAIQKVAAEAPEHEPELRNVMRKDDELHESGVHTEELLAAAPAREGDRIAVKKVLSKNK